MKPPEWVGKERGGMMGGEEGGSGKREKETILITYLNFAWASATPPQSDQIPPLRPLSLN